MDFQRLSSNPDRMRAALVEHVFNECFARMKLGLNFLHCCGLDGPIQKAHAKNGGCGH